MVEMNVILKSLQGSMLIIDFIKTSLLEILKTTKDFLKSFVVGMKRIFSGVKRLFSKVKEYFHYKFFSKSRYNNTMSIFDSVLINENQSKVVDMTFDTRKTNILKLWNKNKGIFNKNSLLLTKNKNKFRFNKGKYLDLLKLQKSSFLRADSEFDELSIERARTF